MYKKVYLDANILVDIMDPDRRFHKFSSKLFVHCLETDIELVSSCDIITTIYYIESKRDKSNAINKVVYFNGTIRLIDFSNSEVTRACNLLAGNNFIDLENTIQYVLAKKSGCDVIVSNDKSFVSIDIPVLDSKEFCNRFEL